MKKIQLATAVAALAIAGQSYAAYTTSGTGGDINVAAQSATSVYYTGPTNGSSNTGYAAITPDISGDWDFDFTDLNNVSFTGNIYLGDYETQTNVTGFPVIDGHQSFTNGNHAIAGTGTYNEATNTFSFSIASGGANASGGSDFTRDSASCQNGSTSIFGTVCGTWSGTTGDWEGLQVDLVFSEDRSTFSGSVQGIEQSGSGLTANTTTINFSVNGVSEVPVPAAAWLFGSALIGLAGVGRRKSA